MDKKNAGIFQPVRRVSGKFNHLKEDGILTKSNLTESDDSGLGTFMDDRPIHPMLENLFKSSSHDWNKVK